LFKKLITCLVVILRQSTTCVQLLLIGILEETGMILEGGKKTTVPYLEKNPEESVRGCADLPGDKSILPCKNNAG